MPALSVLCLRVALVYLGTGFTIGALMLGTHGTDLSSSLLRLRPLHTEFLLIGWTVQLAFGVAYWILPRRPSSERGNERLAGAALVLLNLGVLTAGLAATFGAPGSIVVLGRAAELAAALGFAAHAWPRIRAYSPARSRQR